MKHPALRLLPLLVVGLAGLTSFAACTRDEPAALTPTQGLWLYTETDVVQNTCNADLTLDTETTFLIDNDEGDIFEVRRYGEDIQCEIDGYDFSCASIQIATVPLDGFDATLSFDVSYEGTFDIETEGSGTQEAVVTCIGDDCNLVDDTVPCQTITRFDIEYTG